MSSSTISARGRRNGSSFILSCVRTVFSEPPLQGRWLPAEQLCLYMHQKCNIGNDIKFDITTMMRVINKVFPLVSSEPNILEIPGGVQLRVFRYTFQHRTRRYFFWVTAKVGVIPAMPSKGNATAWEQDCVLTRLLSARDKERPSDVEMCLEPEPKRQKGSSVNVNPSTGNALGTDEEHASKEAPVTAAGTMNHEVTSGDWWESGDARRLFAPCTILYASDCNVREIVMQRIEILESVNHSASKWSNVVDTTTGCSIVNAHYSESDVFSLRYRSMYLALALKQFVLNVTGDLRSQWTWKRCLCHSIEAMNDVGVEYYSSFATLARWHRKFARHRYYFYKAPDAKAACPRFFVENPDAMDAFKKHGVANIKDLRVEMMLEYVHNELVPKLMLKRDGCLFDDDGNDVGVGVEKEIVTPTTRAAFLNSYCLSSISMATIARWMHSCGFRYKKREKHYFVDGHERPETLAYRPVFTEKYLSYEVRAHRWLQMTLDESNKLLLEGSVIANCGYNYVADDGTDMVEYHIDTSYAFQDRLTLLPFGGSLSVRKPIGSNTVIYVGQDEAIFKQFLFLTKMWVGPSGERPLLPKDEGTGTMISTFICREHGLIREISPEVLSEVSLKRAGQQYADQEAAIEILGSPDKKPLTLDRSPFLVFFEYGENREGYWAYNNMVLQFEDAVDVLKVMHPSYDFVFLFDHSAGHAKQRPDGLNHHRMNRAFGGKTIQMMRDTIILQEEGYLGTFPRILEPGDTQSLVFPASDTSSGPFWMSSAEKDESRYDKNLGSTTAIKLKIPEMIQHLQEKGVRDTLVGKSIRQLRALCTQHGIVTHKLVALLVERNRSELELDLQGKGISTKGKNKRELVEICEQHHIAITKTEDKIKEGWEGKPKGLLQVLWERGLIDGSKLKDYSLTGKKDDLGTVDNSTSLRHIMGMCHDFLNEEGMLQHIAKNLGVTVLLTPKCHAELAGEGVEYVWACAKGAYRNMSLKQKKGKDNFKASVRYCLSEEVITKVRIRKFARRARQYLMAYHAIDTKQVDEQTQHDSKMHGPVALTKVIGEFKTHRCAFDFDHKFVMSA